MERNLKDLVKIETALVALGLVLAIVWFSLFQGAGDAKGTLQKTEERLAAVRKELQSFRTTSGKDTEALQKELEQLANTPAPGGLPSRQEALILGTRLASFLAERNLTLSAFDSSQSIITLGKDKFPAISYTLSARGSVDDLMGLVRLANEFPTAVVQGLEFTKDKDAWTMSLNVAVFYDEAARQG